MEGSLLMSLPRAYLRTRLTKTLHTTDEGALVIVGDSCRYVMGLPKHRELRRVGKDYGVAG